MSNTPETLPSVYYALVIDGEVATNFKVCVAIEAVVAAMSSNPTITLDSQTETYCTYNLTVDDELASTLPWPKNDEMMNAIFQSNPTVIVLTDELLEIGIGPGWLWNGTEFTEAT